MGGREREGGRKRRREGRRRERGREGEREKEGGREESVEYFCAFLPSFRSKLAWADQTKSFSDCIAIINAYEVRKMYSV